MYCEKAFSQILSLRRVYKDYCTSSKMFHTCMAAMPPAFAMRAEAVYEFPTPRKHASPFRSPAARRARTVGYIGAWHSLGGLAQRGSGSRGLSHGPAWCGAEVTLHVLGDGLERVLLRGRLQQCVVVLGHLA